MWDGLIKKMREKTGNSFKQSLLVNIQVITIKIISTTQRIKVQVMCDASSKIISPDDDNDMSSSSSD